MIRLLLAMLLLSAAAAANAAAGDSALQLGILANRPKDQEIPHWQPLASYLSSALARPVALSLYNHEELDVAASQHAVDVVLTAAAHNILLQHVSGLSAPLATLISYEQGHAFTAFGGVIFTRAELGGQIASLADLAGKRIAAVSTEAFGSYQMQALELLEAGMPLPSGDRLLLTGLPQDRVVEAVLAGRADAGFVRAGLLEAMARDSKLELARIRVINRQPMPDFPYPVSTRLYPEWPVSVMPQVDGALAARLAAALFSLPHGSFQGAAASVHGFTIPANYDAVESLMRRLRVPPFDGVQPVSLADLWLRYAHWIVASAALMGLLAAATAGLIVLYRRARHSEAMIRAFNAELESRVRKRTAELETANAELIQARDAADSANRAKSVFLANMSHELRTPLNAILGFAQLMGHDEGMSADARHGLETINRAGRHLLSLINDVLEISRIEAGRTQLHNEAYDFNDMLRSVEEMIRVRAEQKGLAFTVQAQGSLPRYVFSDAHHLRQVLVNLLGNAVKYTDHGSVSLRLVAGGERIRFEVADTGPGIAVEDQGHIFQAFYQTAAGVAKGEGTGLGLTISREFVRLMGGELTVHSELGRGSVFSFSLPLPEVPAPAIASRPGRVLGLAAGQAAPRILVAEDHPDNRELITRMLKIAGFQVRSVDNGQRAVAVFQSWQPRFIWMDMRMPVLDGYQATRKIRALPGGDGVKIVALTASAFHEDRNAILQAGCDDLLAKPVEEDRLFALMGDLLHLEFRYAGEDRNGVAPAYPALDLSGLDAESMAAIRQAAESLDMDACMQISQRIRPQHADAADALEAALRDFRFELIQRAASAEAEREHA